MKEVAPFLRGTRRGKGNPRIRAAAGANVPFTFSRKVARPAAGRGRGGRRRGPRPGSVAGADEMAHFEAEPPLNESETINLSTVVMGHGTGPATAHDRAAGPRRARAVGEANRGKGGDHTCAFC